MKKLLFVLFTVCSFYSQAQLNIDWDELKEHKSGFSLSISGIPPTFAFKDEAPYSSNLRLSNQVGIWNLSAEYLTLLQGDSTGSIPMTLFDLDDTYGRNGFNSSSIEFQLGYQWGGLGAEIDRNEVNFGFSGGLFKDGGGMRVFSSYTKYVLATDYDASSSEKFLEYKLGIGGEIGFDGSASRSVEEIRFFEKSNEKFFQDAIQYGLTPEENKRFSEEFNRLVENSLPKKFGGAFYLAPVVKGRLYMNLFRTIHPFVEGNFRFDIMSFLKEGKRGQTNAFVKIGIVGYPFQIFSED